VRITDLTLNDSTINLAADEILAHIATLKDTDDTVIFQSVKRGVWTNADKPNEDNVPACRLWYRTVDINIESDQFYTGEREVQYVLCLYFWLPQLDVNAQPIDAMQLLTNLAETVLKSLQYTDSSGVGFSWSNYWRPVSEQTVSIDFAPKLQRFNEVQPLNPPWYVATITFNALVFNQ
jgi:hypothetical protein